MEWETRVKRISRANQIEVETSIMTNHHSTTTLSSPTSLSFAHNHCASRDLAFPYYLEFTSKSLLNKGKRARFHDSNLVIILRESFTTLIIKANYSFHKVVKVS